LIKNLRWGENVNRSNDIHKNGLMNLMKQNDGLKFWKSFFQCSKAGVNEITAIDVKPPVIAEP
jgi:competence transcription factor ComK